MVYIVAILAWLPLSARCQSTAEQDSVRLASSFQAYTQASVADRLHLNLPTYAQSERARTQAIFARRSDGTPNKVFAGPTFNLNKSNDPQYRNMGAQRFLGESVHAFFLHPARFADIGVGYSDRRQVYNTMTMSRDISRYGIVRFNLDRGSHADKRRWFVPLGTYTETEVSPKNRVARKDYTYKDVHDSISHGELP